MTVTTACVEWTRARNRKGYGYFHDRGRTKIAHRAAWEAGNGPIPAGLMVLHHCDNPPCVNVEHLYVGTALDNARDRVARRRQPEQHRTHCPQGHPYDAANTDLRRTTRGFKRRCRECSRIACRAYRRAVRDPQLVP